MLIPDTAAFGSGRKGDQGKSNGPRAISLHPKARGHELGPYNSVIILGNQTWSEIIRTETKRKKRQKLVIDIARVDLA